MDKNDEKQKTKPLGNQGYQKCPCGETVHWPLTPLELAEHGKHITESDRPRIRDIE